MIKVVDLNKLKRKKMKVDLRKCEKGDVLISVHGNALIYVGKTRLEPYPYDVAYVGENLGNGSRTQNGQVFIHNRMETDEDVAFIMKEHMGEIMEFEYKGEKDADIITPALIKAVRKGWIKKCRIC